MFIPAQENQPYLDELKYFFDENQIYLKMSDGSHLEMFNFQRSMERNVLKRYGHSTERPIFFFNNLIANHKKEGRGTFLMECVAHILDQNNFWVLNEVRPTPFSIERLEKLIYFYERHGFELLERGKDAALMLRRPKN